MDLVSMRSLQNQVWACLSDLSQMYSDAGSITERAGPCRTSFCRVRRPFASRFDLYSFTVIITKGSMSMLLMPNLYGALVDIPKEMQSRGLLSDPCDILFDPSDGRCMSKEVRLIRRSGDMGIEERCARLPDFGCTRTSCLWRRRGSRRMRDGELRRHHLLCLLCLDRNVGVYIV